jgi:hypothetical protein
MVEPSFPCSRPPSCRVAAHDAKIREFLLRDPGIMPDLLFLDFIRKFRGYGACHRNSPKLVTETQNDTRPAAWISISTLSLTRRKKTLGFLSPHST